MADLSLRADCARGNPMPLLDRAEIEALIESLIEALDSLDGDPDLEDDDPAGVNDEDGRNTCFHFRDGSEGPGCSIAEAGV